MNSVLARLSIFCLFVLLACSKENNPAPTPSTPTQTAPTISSVSPLSGTVGTRVVITGTGFSATLANNTVKFGSIAAALDSASTTRLVTKVPQGAQTGKISVQVSGTTISSNTDFTVTVAPVATAPTFSTAIAAQSFINVGITTAQVVSVLGQTGNQSITQHGHVWSKTSPSPSLTSNNGKTELGPIASTVSSPYNFTSNLTSLEAATSYTVRAYVSTQAATTYGSSFTVTTLPSTTPTGTNCRLATIVSIDTWSGVRSESSIVYDAQGRISQIKPVSISSGAQSPSIFTYATTGELMAVDQPYTDSEGLDGSRHTTFTYANGRLTQFAVKTFYKGKVEFDQRYAVTLNSAGQLSQLQQISSSGELVPGISLFIFDASGNLTALVGTDKGVQRLTLEISYDNQRSVNNSIISSPAHRLASIGIPYGANWQSFGVNNALSVKSYKLDQSGVNVVDQSWTYTYKYNTNGFPIQEVSTQNSSWGTYITTTTFTYSNCQ